MDYLWVISVCSLCCSEYFTSDLRVIFVCSLCFFLSVFLVSSALTSSLLGTLSECTLSDLRRDNEYALSDLWVMTEWYLLLWVPSLQREWFLRVFWVLPITTNLGMISECALGVLWVYFASRSDLWLGLQVFWVAQTRLSQWFLIRSASLLSCTDTSLAVISD